MRPLLLLLVSLACAGCAGRLAPRATGTGPATAEGAGAVAARVAAVERGLIPPVIIKDVPLPAWHIEERMRFYNVPGLSIAVVNNGRLEWAKGYGVKKNGSADPVTRETLFAAGSVSKPVAAMAALRLVQEGRLDLNQNVNERLTSWKVPENEFTTHEKVSLRRILNHTSGLPVAGGNGLPADDVSIVDALSGGRGLGDKVTQVEFTPGARQRYSNAAYGLLGLLLEDVTKLPAQEALRLNVLEPLGMANSTFAQRLPESLRARTAAGHNSLTGEAEQHAPSSPALGASGLWSTPSDLAKFMIELQAAKTTGKGKVLTRETADYMLTPSRGIWSHGLQVDTTGQTPRFWHDGSVPGFTSYMIGYNWRGQGAVVMVNGHVYNGIKLLNEVMFAVARVYGWTDFGPIERVSVPPQPQLYPGYEGTYEIDQGYPITIVARGGKLYLIWALGAVFEMHPSGPDSFFIVREEAPEFRFSRDAAGNVTGVTRTWGGGAAKAARVPLPPPSRGATEFHLRGHANAMVVSLVGDFNDWKIQKTLCNSVAGGWSCRADMPSGEQRYAFLVDGRQIADPARPSEAKSPDGGAASVIRVAR
jgi:CubicO group peptidase (beta-lactamase class C family)